MNPEPKEENVQPEREYVCDIDSPTAEDVFLSQEYPLSVFHDVGVW